ncbi:Indole-3-acetic acid-amido synthetase GH3.3 [Holothuria leucospilota]|uniref:Indole-3-acetic acid-amido synthetase GH3.3 n=1 Tax=Holothuria leucospilota TaxID=206669 RepID=A0A9Q1C5H4_HOLLE|nr:Indole-3-acetic acid-amido synthetase GH3.3 [Holothuria leucospilota]
MAIKFYIATIFLLLASIVIGSFGIVFAKECLLPWYLVVALAGVPSLLCFTLGVVLYIIATQLTPEHYSIYAALLHFIIKYHRLYAGARMLRRFRASCEKPRKVQEDVLQQIIRMNKYTDYGRQCNLGDIHSLQELQRKHPLTEYSHYKSLVDRVGRGEKNVITGEKVTRLILTSGTTGEGKKIPQDGYFADNIMTLQEALQHEMFPGLNPMQSRLKIHCNGKIRQSKCDLNIATGMTVEPYMVKYMVVYSSPPDSFMIEKVHEATYVHLLFGLRDRNVGCIYATFSSLLLEVLNFLQINWKKLVEDISCGTLDPKLELDPCIRRNLTNALGSGDSRRALEVQKECEKGFDGILKRLWPHLKLISAIDNVGLRDCFKQSAAKGVEIYSPMYVSSETLIGLNLWPFNTGEEEYALNLSDSVFEFIPEEDMDKPNPPTYFVDEIEVGRNYELLFTQRYGLCRYKFGDVIKVTGFYKNCPKVKFLYRKATLMNLVGEKVDQGVIQESLKEALSPWADSTELSYYSVAENTLRNDLFLENSEAGQSNVFYVYFLELTTTDGGKLPSDLKPELLAQEIDKNLCKRHEIFNRHFNFTNFLTHSKVYFVKTGTFHQLREYILATTTTSRTQFKMPLKLRTEEMTDIMLKNIHH